MGQALENACERVSMVDDVVFEMRELETDPRHFVKVHTRKNRPQDRHSKSQS